MTSLMLPSLHSTPLLAQLHSASAITEAAPWRPILAVEPDIDVLNAKSRLLAQANYCVTKASSDHELFALQGTKAVALAILSDRLGQRLLGTVAQTIRRQWPRARILILGQAGGILEDYLYDEQITRSADPKQVLAELESLYWGMWNQHSNTLDWSAARSARCLVRPRISESDPTKIIQPPSVEDQNFRDRPSDMRPSSTQRN